MLNKKTAASRMFATVFDRLPLWFWLSWLAVVTILLRLPLLNGSFWLDEAAQALEVIRPWSEQLNLANDFQPPLFHLILHVWQYVGHQEWWLRLVSLFAGVGSVVLASAWAWRWQGKRSAMVVGLLLATSSLHVFFSQELRPYMLAVWWAMLALTAYWAVIWPKGDTRYKPRWLSEKAAWILLTLANLAGALTSYVYLFWLVGMWLSSIWLGRRLWGKVTRSLLVTGLFWLAWLPGLLSQLAASAALRAAVPGWENVVSLSQLKAIPLTIAKFWVGVIPIDLVLTDALLIILPCIFVFYLVWKHWQTSDESAKKQLLVLVTMLVGTLVASWLFSFWTPVISPKRVLFLLPILYLIISQVYRVNELGLWLVGLVLFLNIWGVGRYWQDVTLQREDWRTAVTMIEARYHPDNTVVVFGFDGPFAPWEWYQRENIPTISTGFKPLSSTQQAQEALAQVHTYENVVLFEYLLDLSDPQRYLQQVLAQKGFELLDTLDFYTLGFIRLYHQQRFFALNDPTRPITERTAL